MFKLGLLLVYLALFSIVSLPMYLYVRIIKKKDELKAADYARKIICGAFKFLFINLGVKVKCIGVENVPKDEPVLFVGNHRGYADIAAAYMTLPVATGFVAKKEMRKAPCISNWLTHARGVYLDRKNPKEGLKAILEAIDNVNKGISMFIMPEGTRSHGDEMIPFKKGSLKIAEKTKCSIVPVAFTNTDHVFERQYPRITKANIIIEYGKPIYVRDLTSEQMKTLTEDVQAVIKEMLDKNSNKA